MKYLIFGGTGSLGRHLNEFYLEQRGWQHNVVINFSRDECKHWKMKLDFRNNPRQHFTLGDAANKQDVTRAIRRWNPEVIIIAQAMKHIDQCETNQELCIRNNVTATKIILDTIEEYKRELHLRTVVFVSSDKACSPVNSYGMCKALSEQLVLEKQHHLGSSRIKFACVRYGNVLNSRGSIIPILHNIGQDPEKKEFKLTHPEMTRFVMTLDDSVALIDHAIMAAEAGDTVIPNLRSLKIKDLIEIFSEHYDKPIVETGLRLGEKIHEALINPTQSTHVVHKNGYYHIRSHFRNPDIKVDEMRNYDSRIEQMSKDALREYLKELSLL